MLVITHDLRRAQEPSAGHARMEGGGASRDFESDLAVMDHRHSRASRRDGPVGARVPGAASSVTMRPRVSSRSAGTRITTHARPSASTVYVAAVSAGPAFGKNHNIDTS